MWLKSYLKKRKQEKQRRLYEEFVQKQFRYFEKLRQEADESNGSDESISVCHDFGKGFKFTNSKGSRVGSLLILLNDENEGPNDRKRKSKRYSNKYFPLIMRISCDVPTFDYGDRRYDSRHNLVLFKYENKVYSIFYSEGYSIGSVEWLGRVTACPPGFAKKLGLMTANV